MRILFQIILFVIFTGSVFVTSGKFVNTTNTPNTPKFYFVIVSLLVIITIVTVSQSRLKLGAFTGRIIFWGIITVCCLQANYGMFQFIGWLPSNHPTFAVTGSFDNPAGFAAVLAMGFPIGLFLLSKTKKIEKYFTGLILLVIAVAVFLSGSRSGVLAILVSNVPFLLIETEVIRTLRQLRYYKLLSVLVLGLLVSGAFMLYSQKKGSANGRLLIWKVSTGMIKDKPVFGHGYGAFNAKYMDYQAEYFKNNPGSKYAQRSLVCGRAGFRLEIRSGRMEVGDTV